MNGDADIAIKAFFAGLDLLPVPDLNDKKTWNRIQEELDNAIRPEIEAQERLQNRSFSRLFKVVR